MMIATTPQIEAIKYHAGSFVRQAGQRVRVGVTTLSQLRHVIQITFAAQRHKYTKIDPGFSFVFVCLFVDPF